MVAERHDSKNGFVAVDNFEFIENDECLVIDFCSDMRQKTRKT